LRILANGNFDVAGTGGVHTVFKVKQWGAKNEVKLESNAHGNKYLAIKKDGVLKIGSGGDRCEFTIFRD
jgi:hypothetical protein